MTHYTLRAEPMVLRVSLGTPTLTVGQAPNSGGPNPFVTEFKRSAALQLGKAVIRVPQAVLTAALLWLLHRFLDH
jgi:hypothetical protein